MNPKKTSITTKMNPSSNWMTKNQLYQIKKYKKRRIDVGFVERSCRWLHNLHANAIMCFVHNIDIMMLMNVKQLMQCQNIRKIWKRNCRWLHNQKCQIAYRDIWRSMVVIALLFYYYFS